MKTENDWRDSAEMGWNEMIRYGVVSVIGVSSFIAFDEMKNNHFHSNVGRRSRFPITYWISSTSRVVHTKSRGKYAIKALFSISLSVPIHSTHAKSAFLSVQRKLENRSFLGSRWWWRDCNHISAKVEKYSFSYKRKGNSLRGKLLRWKYCCINCMFSLPPPSPKQRENRSKRVLSARRPMWSLSVCCAIVPDKHCNIFSKT